MTSPAKRQAPEDLRQSAAELAVELRTEAAGIDAQRCIPLSVITRLRDRQLLGILRPLRYGGPEYPFRLLADIAATLGYESGSTAWVYSVTGAHDLLVGLFPDHVQQEYWASTRPMCASSYLPTGRAAVADGGFVLSGKWSFGSGIDHCDWVMVGAVISGSAPQGPPDRRFFLLRTREVELIDDWFTMGLAGTGSKSIAIKEVFVPDDRAVREVDTVRGTTAGAVLHTNPIYRNSVWPLLRYSIVAPLTGIVRGAYDSVVVDYTSRAANKEPVFEGMNQAVQISLADASARLEAAQALFDRGLEATCATIAAGGPIPDLLRVNIRRDQGFMGELCRAAMNSLMSLAGGRGIRDSSKVQRAMRDVMALSAHPSANWDRAAISFGSFSLGRGPTESF